MHRIKALISFKDVEAGTLGGWIEKEKNISHDGYALVSGDARVINKRSLYWISSVGSRNGTTTFFKCLYGYIRVKCGCFSGTLVEFENAVKKTHGENEHGRVYALAIEIAKIRLGDNNV